MMIAQSLEHGVGEAVVNDLGFLKAQHVGGVLDQKPLDDIEAEPDRIDVPGGDTQGHGARCNRSAAVRHLPQ